MTLRTKEQRLAERRERDRLTVEHAASLARRAERPRNLLLWFLEAFRAECPAELHAGGVWRDRVSAGEAEDGIQPVGGSLLGSPRLEEGFRRFIEDGAFVTERAELEGHQDHAPHYVTPLRAALARLAGRGPDADPRVFMSRVLYRTALLDGDWPAACASMGIIEPVAGVYIQEALRRLWDRYWVEPRPRPYRAERSQEVAVAV